jgi:hypothetical protein
MLPIFFPDDVHEADVRTCLEIIFEDIQNFIFKKFFGNIGSKNFTGTSFEENLETTSV